MSEARERSGKGLKAKDALVSIMVNGLEVIIDPSTLTMSERQVMKRTLAGLGYEPDGLDIMGVTIWIVMKRSDEALTFEEVSDALDVQTLERMESVEPEDQDGASPEG